MAVLVLLSSASAREDAADSSASNLKKRRLYYPSYEKKDPHDCRHEYRLAPEGRRLGRAEGYYPGYTMGDEPEMDYPHYDSESPDYGSSGKKGGGESGSGKKGSGDDDDGYGYDEPHYGSDSDDDCYEYENYQEEVDSGDYLYCEPDWEQEDNPCVPGCGHGMGPNQWLIQTDPEAAYENPKWQTCKNFDCICTDSPCFYSWDETCVKAYIVCQENQVCGDLSDAPYEIQSVRIPSSCYLPPSSGNPDFCYGPLPTPPPVPPP
eukprot:CAMPEP_0178769578 /NCGR_PEP_ID=MMETSP0744-20121128/20910_1 /TAXON_ID=913974 /ORGANISM="Nitzschia punctata, Strain CCMP561" /LENGTH=262 /DNA_ID=CAMNT_0020425851 /DNA_START=185 /DNA_END=969 /DNA_ORIENTATION=+